MCVYVAKLISSMPEISILSGFYGGFQLYCLSDNRKAMHALVIIRCALSICCDLLSIRQLDKSLQVYYYDIIRVFYHHLLCCKMLRRTTTKLSS